MKLALLINWLFGLDVRMAALSSQLTRAEKRIRKDIMATKQQFVQDMQAAVEQARKVHQEYIDKVAELDAKVVELTAAVEAAGNSTPEMDSALADIRGIIGEMDQMKADAVVVPPAEPGPIEDGSGGGTVLQPGEDGTLPVEPNLASPAAEDLSDPAVKG